LFLFYGVLQVQSIQDGFPWIVELVYPQIELVFHGRGAQWLNQAPRTKPGARSSLDTGASLGFGQWEFQDPIHWRYVNVPYFWLYFLGIFPEI
jgi:hypothetical protein